MTVHDFHAEADLIGRRVRLRWAVAFDEGEGLADVPAVRVRRKERDVQFTPPPPAAADPFGVYDAAAFPPPGTTARELPIEEGRVDGVRWVRVVTSASVEAGGQPVEVLRTTVTTRVRDDGQPVERVVEVLDVGAGVGGLVPNTTYYYVLEGPAGRLGVATARPGEGHGTSRRLYDMVPALHRRHDTIARGPTPGAEAVPEAAPRAGQLQRFLDLFGAAVDLMRSSADGLAGLHDVQTVDARYLPLLAGWVGWDLGVHRPIPQQRHEVGYAPDFYQVTGTIPSALLWTRHATGWPARVKEYVHNVARANEPPGLNLWLRRDDGGAWTDPERPLRLDDAPAGRPAAAALPDGSTLVVYESRRMDRAALWATTHRPGEGWADEAPVTDGRTRDADPALVAVPGGEVWLFRTAYDALRRRWRVVLSRRAPGAEAFDAPEALGDLLGLPEADRRRPTAALDPAGDLWVVWQEAAGTGWTTRYARFDGAWSAPINFLDAPGGAPVPVEGRPFLVASDAPGEPLWLLWRQALPTGEPGQTRTALFARPKAVLSADAGGWGPIERLSADPPAFHDSDPAAVAGPDGRVELVFASTRASGWSLWRQTRDADAAVWTAPEPLPATAARDRFPVPLVLEGALAVLYRSDRAPVYESAEPGGIRSADLRYTGTTLAHVANGDAQALRGRYADRGSYTLDLGAPGGPRTDADRYAEDTVGLFAEPTSLDAAAVGEGISRLRQVLPLGLPATRRAVLATRPDRHDEFVYDYRRPGVPAPRAIGETVHDAITSPLETVVFEGGSDFTDALDPS